MGLGDLGKLKGKNHPSWKHSTSKSLLETLHKVHSTLQLQLHIKMSCSLEIQRFQDAINRGVIFIPGVGLTTEDVAIAPSLVRQTADMMPDTTARCCSSCDTCGDDIDVGDRITTVSSFGAASLIAGALPQEMQEMIAAAVGLVEQSHHADCAGINQTTTRSGRVSRAPVRLSDEKFIAGSGFSGCDHYDRSFNGHLKMWEAGPFSTFGANLNGFVVDDEMQSEPIELPSSDDEGEWKSDDETDDEGEWVPSDDEE